MQEPLRAVVLRVLQACRERGTLHPRVDAAALDLPREQLDQALDHLRLGGFVEIADWAADRGQGYRLTPAGHAAADDPRLLDRPAPAPAPPPAEMRFEPDGEETRRALMAPEPARVTPALIALNLLVFAVGAAVANSRGVPFNEYLSGARPERFDLGTLNPLRLFVLDEWWRLVTYGFIHRGIIHLLVNMYALNGLGRLMEARWGWKRFLILYFGSLVIAGCAVPLLQRDTSAVGASGAICGLLTSVALWAWMYRDALPPQVVEAHFRAAGINVVLLVVISMIPGVSWSCHLGGAVAGVLLSIPLAWLDRRSPWRHWIVAVVVLLAIAGVTAAALAMIVAPRYAPLKKVMRIEDTDRQLTRLFVEEVKPLLDKGVEPETMTPARAAELRGRFEAAADLCRKTAASVKESFPVSNRPVARMVETFVRRAELLESMEQLLADPAAWPEARRDELARKWGDIDTSWIARQAMP